MSFYSLTSYSQLRVNQSALGGGSTPPFTNTLSTLFDGVDDFCETASTYSELDATTKATISLWVKPSLGGSQILSRLSDSTNQSAFVYQLFTKSTGDINIQIGDTAKKAITATGVLTANVYAHILIAYDGSLSTGSRTKIFVNGVDRTSSDNTTAIRLSNAAYPLQVGRRDFGSGLNYEGNIDEFAIWATTDQRANVAEIYNGGVPNDLNTLPTAPNPTTWYRMGDGDTAPTILDKNGSANLTMNNMSGANFVADVPPSPFTNTLSTLFDGVDDSVSMASNINLGTNASFSFWMKRNNTALNVPFGFGTNWYEFLVRIRSTVVEFSNGGGYNNATTLAAINQTTDWTHMLFVRTGATCNLYVNGVNNDGAKTVNNPATDVLFRRIGTSGDGATWAFSGLIDEVSVYNTALSASDATAIYNGGVPTDLTSYAPLGWFRMGDGSTYPTINDIGSGGSNGTMNNMSASNFVTDVPT